MAGVQRSEPTSIWSLGLKLGEGPVWVGREQALWFVDIKGPRIYRLDPASGERRSWDAPAQCGFVLPAAAGGFVAGLQTGLHRFDPEDGSFAPMVDPEPERPGNRLNDGTVDPSGRLWFGTMDDAEAADTGAIYRLDGEGGCVRSSPWCSITNGPAVSPDGGTLYHHDTLGGIVYACRVAADGSLTHREVFATIPSEDGYPDGPTVDAEGCVWIGLYRGGAVRRYSPRGELIETVRFPVDAITKVAFGGSDLTTLYATTASKHLSPAEHAAMPQAGDLFAFEVGVPGVAATEITVGI